VIAKDAVERVERFEFLLDIPMDKYLEDARLKEIVTADLFLELDRYASERKKRAQRIDGKLEKFLSELSGKNEHLPDKRKLEQPQSKFEKSLWGQSQIVEGPKKQRRFHDNSKIKTVWVVGPELADMVPQAFELATELLSHGYQVHLVTRLLPEHLADILDETSENCRVRQDTCTATPGKNAASISPEESVTGSNPLASVMCDKNFHYHFVKPLQDYHSHLKTKGNIVTFYLPLSASLAVNGYKHLCVLSTPFQETVKLLQSSTENPDSRLLVYLPDFILSQDDQTVPTEFGRTVFAFDLTVLEYLFGAKTPPIPVPPHIPTVSACIIAKDEEGMIEDCLLSLVPVTDEVILNDTGSKDNTYDIAREFGAKVFKTVWENDFSKARNACLERAKEDYILSIDADERVMDDSKRIFKRELLSGAHGYFLSVLNYSESSSTLVGDLLRLFKNLPSHRFARRIHEQICSSISGPVAYTSIRLMHHGYGKQVIDIKGKPLRNIRLLSEELSRDASNLYDIFQLGVEMKTTGNFAEAVKLLRHAYENADKARPFVPYAALHACESYLSLGQLDQALDFAREVLGTYPEFLALAETVADNLLAAERAREAKDLLCSTASANSRSFLPQREGADTFIFHWLLARAELALGNVSTSLNQLKESLRYNPDWPPSQTLLVEHWPTLAEQVLFELKPKTVKPAVLHFLNLNRIDDAKCLASKMGDLGALGEVYLTSKEFSKAVNAFLKSNEQWDRERAAALALSHMADVNNAKITTIYNDKRSAIYYVFRPVPAPGGRISSVIKLLGFLLDIRALSQFNSGICALKNADDPDFLIGKLLYQRGYFNLASGFLTKSCAKQKHPETLAMLATIAFKKQLYPDSAVFFKGLRAFRILTCDEYIHYATALLHEKKVAEALNVLKEAQSIYPNNRSLDKVLTMVHRLQDKIESS